jgi:hypothetical protein
MAKPTCKYWPNREKVKYFCNLEVLAFKINDL